MSTALGGVALSRGGVLAAGGGGIGIGRGGAGVPPLPNGYRFFNVVTPGLADYGLALRGVSGGVMMSDCGEIFFHAQNAKDGFGLYGITMDYTGETPVAGGVRRIVEQGDVLPDGHTVDSIRRGVTNCEGSFAAVLQTEETPGVYLQRGQGELDPIISFLDPAPNGTGQYGAAFGDIDLHDDDDLLVVAHFVDEEEDAEIGLFHLPGSVDSDQGNLVLQTGDLIPGTETPIVNFGLVDIDDEGEYVAQLEGRIPTRRGHYPRSGGTGTGDARASGAASARTRRDRTGMSAVVRGNVYAPSARASMASASRRMVDATTAPVRGEAVFGPRIDGPDTAITTHRRDTVQILTLNERLITRTDARSPLGARIRGVSAPVLGQDGIVYYLLITKLGLELCMSNGQEERTILSRGDRIEGLPVNVILHAWHSQQADAAGRIVFTVEYDNQQSSIVVGLPV